MQSTVGHQCVICRQAIRQAGTAIFCPECGCPCHLKCGKPHGPEMQSVCCVTCGAPRPEIARYKNDRELKLLDQLAAHQPAPKVPLEGRRKIGLVVGCIFMLLGVVRFGLAVSGIDVPALGSLVFALIPLVIGFVIFFASLYLAKQTGW
jgi:hypothetical protein